MGYYTEYTLTHDPNRYDRKNEEKMEREIEDVVNSNIPEETKQNLQDLIKDKYKKFEIYENDIVKIIGFNPFLESCKWYDHVEDMKRVSTHYPDVIFILRGSGEELGDIWAKYFMNGKMQVANSVITIEPFDESKMT